MKRITLKKEFLYLSSILIILIILNYRLLNTWFIIDDTANIFCSSFDTLKLLFDKGTYLYFNQLFYTPLQPISFKPDWFLFKMNPLGYHISNLLIAYLCCISFYIFQRTYLNAFPSWLGTIFFTCSLPLSFGIGWITRKHYLWGFLLALLALHLFKKWESNKKNYILLFSLASTLLAVLFKEAYTFLPAAIFLLSSGSLKERAKRTIPYFFVLAIYIFWRVHMLGSLGGYAGSTGESLSFYSGKLFNIPMNLSGNLYGLSILPLLVLVIVAALNVRMFLLIVSILIITISPFIFVPAGDFLLANKALSFVAVISFALSYVADRLSSKHKKLSIIFLLLLVPVLLGSLSKTRDGQNVIIRLSDIYEKASKEIIGNRDKKILIVGNYSYYFSNLEDIYRNLLKEDFPYIKAISDPVILPLLKVTNFGKVIVINNLDLAPDVVYKSSVNVIEKEAKDFIKRNSEEQINKMILSPPLVNFTKEKDYLKIEVNDSRTGTYLRCLSMGSYVGCYPIPRYYIFKLNSIKNIDRIDIIYVPGDGPISLPSSFLFQQG